MRYFVTGAGGFIGRHLCRALLAQGKSVTALVRPGAREPIAGARVVEAGLDEPQIYGPALADCDYVVHLAALARYGDGAGYRFVNVEATAKLLEAVRVHAQGLHRFVFVSTIGAVDRVAGDPCREPLTEAARPNPASDYGRSKLEAERLVAACGLPYAIVRPAMVVGADMRVGSHIAVFARAALSRGPLSWVRWPGQLSIIHVDDLVEGLIAAAEHAGASGKTFFAAGEAVALSRLFDWARPSRARLPASWLAWALRPFMRLLPFDAKVLLYPTLTASDAALRALGWKPRRDGQASVAEVIDRERARIDPALPPAGRTVVTGAASGLGRALAESLGAGRRSLLLIDKDFEALEDVCRGRADVIRLSCDLADEKGLEALLAGEAWSAQPIAEVFACAGFGLRGPVAAMPVKAQADIYRVNVLSRLQIAHAALQSMRRMQFGRIILVSSSSAYQPLPYMSVYAASNAALLLFGEGLSAEVKSDGIEVLTVCPGGMQTQFQRRAGVRVLPGETLMTPQAVCGRILASLGKNEVVIMPSLRSKAMSLAARLLPRRVSLALWRRLMERAR